MKLLDLFAGIGGFSLAAHWMGWETAAFVEKEKFCQKVLRKNFGPDIEIYDDIFTFSGDAFRGRVDIVTGGFPCQPFSAAGKRKGRADERHLFPEMLRVIREVKPRWVVAENVRGLLSIESGSVFAEVVSSLESENYEVITFCVPASAVEAPHRRDRLWIVARGIDRGDRARRNATDTLLGGENAHSAANSRKASLLRRNGPSDVSARSTEYASVTENPRTSGRHRIERDDASSGRCGSDQPGRSERTDGSEYVADANIGTGGSGNVTVPIRAAHAESGSDCSNAAHAKRIESRPRLCEARAVEDGNQSRDGGGHAADTESLRRQDWLSGREQERKRRERPYGCSKPDGWPEHWYEAAARFCRVDDGISDRVHRLKALGNSIVPQIAFEIFRAIDAAENK